ncbi:DUF7097 family protein [Natrialbaceae archaeon AArc-T1-2]|uniref:DUF7097 family protein n=1 Tax=Natrialbaceae archaeon AArc-T1-2 TaxID=3053904 RepID=UPI00255A7BF9|nr:hypothetical protein [Natrialbaceae archaeon AArc-T1-2]WIV66412.1 hypothetical protein QQ977_12025 [Natrialbaceae archaeon AArc-T1-2]
MEKTPRGTAVGVDDPYAFAGRCDHLTSEGRCRYASDHAEHDPAFARERADADYRCLAVDREPDAEGTVGDDDPCWADCPHFRSRTRDRECRRCGLAEKRMAHGDERPLLEEHHLSYASDGETVSHSHEITIYLCRWCHAKVHDSWARITDDVAPDPEAVATLEERRGRELDELGFESAADRDGD